MNGMGAALFTGFDYAGVKAALSLGEETATAALFADLQLMEWAALPILNRRERD